jgi:hypothetical protein
VDTGSREENAPGQQRGASVLIKSEPAMLKAKVGAAAFPDSLPPA